MGASSSSPRSTQSTRSITNRYLSSDNSPRNHNRPMSAPTLREQETEIEPNSSESSASASSTPPHSPKATMWCYVKAKTRMHNSTKMTRRSMWFEGKAGASMLIGMGDQCNLRLDDDRCAPVNAKLAPQHSNDHSSIVLYPQARMYRLVGMGIKRHVENNVVELGSVIKVGSVSLEVTALCTDDHDNYYERFGFEIKSGFGGGGGAKGRGEEKAIADEDVLTDQRLENMAEEDDEGNESKRSSSVKGNIIKRVLSKGSIKDSTEVQEDDESVGADVVEQSNTTPSVEDDEIMCYICWGGIEPDKPGASKKDLNPMIRNPCGKCSGSSEFVHLKCILTWIESSSSGHCSICNNPLPQHFASPPPNIELKVVRHRRGHSWVGTRRYRISFAERKHVTIGRDSESDVRLSDRSVCGIHARLSFDKETRQFKLSDCGSMTGTYLQVTEPMELKPQVTTYLKIGRTLLSLRMTQKRNSILHHVLPPWKR